MRIAPVCPDLRPLRGEFDLVGPSTFEPLSDGGFSLAPIESWESVRVTATQIEPWKMVCSLEADFNGTSYRGTGWFVGPHTVVTAAHCLWHPTQGKARNCLVIPGLTGAEKGGEFLKPFGSHESARFSFPDKWASEFRPEWDFAAIQLDVIPVGGAAFGMDSELYPAQISAKVNVAGYPTEFGGAELHHSNDVVEDVLDRLVTYRVDTLKGQSGAPVWVLGNDGKPYVQAIHAYGAGDAVATSLGINVNFGPAIRSDVIQLIQDWIAIQN